jgi:universal stress protein A
MSDLPRIQKILFATDFSEPAENAQQYARELAERLNAELHLLHVVVPVAVPALGAPSVGYIEDTAVIAELEENAHRDMEAMFDQQWRSTHQLVTAVRVGTPVFEIIRYANEQKIDMIVMGTLGRTGLTHLLVGSVAENVVRKAHCPVLTVHRGPA